MRVANITASRHLRPGSGLLTLLMIDMAVVGVSKLAQLNCQMSDRMESF